MNGVGPAVPAESPLSRRLQMAEAAGTAGPTCAPKMGEGEEPPLFTSTNTITSLGGAD